MQYGMSFMLYALEEYAQLERERAVILSFAMRAAYHGTNEEFESFVNKLNAEHGDNTPPPISESDIAAIFG